MNYDLNRKHYQIPFFLSTRSTISTSSTIFLNKTEPVDGGFWICAFAWRSDVLPKNMFEQLSGMDFFLDMRPKQQQRWCIYVAFYSKNCVVFSVHQINKLGRWLFSGPRLIKSFAFFFFFG